MFEMHCDEIIRTLTKRAENVRSRLLSKMLQDHSVANKALSNEYEAIAEKALTSPSNTEHLMELKSYIETVQNVTIFELESRLVNTKERLSFLVDFVTLSPGDIRNNNSVFQWHQRMPEVFQEHLKIVDANRLQYENALKLRRERFIDDLEGYAKQVEEFQTYGDMKEVNRYLKKAQALQQRLDTAAEKVHFVVLITQDIAQDIFYTFCMICCQIFNIWQPPPCIILTLFYCCYHRLLPT